VYDGRSVRGFVEDNVDAPRPPGAKHRMLDLTYPAILTNFQKYIDPARSESASFLVWYLENYYRLDGGDAVDAVCDQRGDKGVDGVDVNSSDETIVVFQTTISQKVNTTIGDKSLREFAGTRRNSVMLARLPL
jgi:hypothetical protein